MVSLKESVGGARKAKNKKSRRAEVPQWRLPIRSTQS
jgi:hypothetical protein